MKTLIYIIGIFFLQTSCYQQEFHPESGDLIFQVGIAQKVQEYGKIKALGATRKQMKQLIFREGILCLLYTSPSPRD